MTDPHPTDSPVDTILQGSKPDGGAATDMLLKGVLVERRSAPPLDRGRTMLDHHYLLAWEHAPVVTEQAYAGRQPTRVTKIPGTLSLGLAGDLVPVRFHTPFQVVACLLEPAMVAELMDEDETSNRSPLHAHVLSEDKALMSLVRLLADEADISGASGRLYGESLALAIMSRFVSNAQRVPVDMTGQGAHALSVPRLRRVIDRMATDLSDDLSLDTLARESGYSRAHFLRMFRAATGNTPHRYLKEMRLEFARDRLATSADPIAEIALSAGFSSQSHLTTLFHARFGVTPAEFRRAL